jgi:NAD(P)-dependent dehydrogenase (short-subunit alcohol dehydrogenase family)
MVDLGRERLIHKSRKNMAEQTPLSKRQQLLDFTNQVVLITGIGCQGPGWGNGLAIATLFARQNAIIFGCDLDISAAEYSKTQILNKVPHADTTVMEANATSGKSMEAFVNACMQKHGRIDILINNVGRSEPGDPVSMSEDIWDRQTDVNLKSVYLTSHYVLPIMEKQSTGGNVVNISSVAGARYIGKPQIAYSATKAAVIQFTKTTAVIYAARKVRMNVVTPGLIDTPLVHRLADKYASGDYEGFRKKRDNQVPMKRMGTAWDVAHAVLFLASREAGYITGSEVVVDGALTCSTGEV